MPVVRLSAIGHAVGTPSCIADLPEAAASSLVSPGHGLVHYRESPEPVWCLAAGAGEQSLSRSGMPVDLLLYASETDPDPTAALAGIAMRLGLADTHTLAVGGHECGNLGPALRLAVDAVRARSADRVLLLLSDAAQGRPRVMKSGLSVFSDGAVACLLDGEDAGGGDFTVDAVVTRTRHRTGATGWDLLCLAELAAECAAGVEKETGRAVGDFHHVVFANYRIPSQKFFASALRVSADRLLPGPAEELGHCFSADPLITLARAAETGALAAGETVLVSSIGPHSWSLAALTRW